MGACNYTDDRCIYVYSSCQPRVQPYSCLRSHFLTVFGWWWAHQLLYITFSSPVVISFSFTLRLFVLLVDGIHPLGSHTPDCLSICVKSLSGPFLFLSIVGIIIITTNRHSARFVASIKSPAVSKWGWGRYPLLWVERTTD